MATKLKDVTSGQIIWAMRDSSYLCTVGTCGEQAVVNIVMEANHNCGECGGGIALCVTHLAEAQGNLREIADITL